MAGQSPRRNARLAAQPRPNTALPRPPAQQPTYTLPFRQGQGRQVVRHLDAQQAIDAARPDDKNRHADSTILGQCQHRGFVGTPPQNTMHAATAKAYRRLLALAAALLLSWTFACRPAWSPDSRQVLYMGKVDGRMAIARHDLATHQSDVVFVTPPEHKFTMPHYLSNDELLLLASKRNPQKELVVTRMSLTAKDKALPGPFVVTTDDDAINHLLLPAVIVDEKLFLGGKKLTRLDLRTGEVQRGEAPNANSDAMVSQRGAGICYVTVHDREHKNIWELGSVDAETLACKVLLKSPAITATDPGWAVLPMPCFSKDLARVALPGERPKQQQDAPTETAILVFHQQQLETVLRLNSTAPTADSTVAAPNSKDKPHEAISIGSLAFSADEATVLAVLARKTETGQRFSLYEAKLADGTTRETTLLDRKETASSKMAAITALQMQLALSPNGKWAAVITAFLDDGDEHEQDLLLVDMSGSERVVQRVPFPGQK